MKIAGRRKLVRRKEPDAIHLRPVAVNNILAAVAFIDRAAWHVLTTALARMEQYVAARRGGFGVGQ